MPHSVNDPNLECTGAERNAVLEPRFRADLSYWIHNEPRVATRIMKLIEEVLRDPVAGIGKPERLKHRERGLWSRRITAEHRFVYLLSDEGPLFVRARHHYSR